MFGNAEKALYRSEATYKPEVPNKPHTSWLVAYLKMVQHCFWNGYMFQKIPHAIVEYTSIGGGTHYCCSICNYSPSPAKCILCQKVFKSEEYYQFKFDHDNKIYYHRCAGECAE